MLRITPALICVAVLSASAAAAEPKPSGELGKEIRIPSNLGIATNVSPDKQAATILFDNLYVVIEPAQKSAAATHNQTALETKLATIHVPCKSAQRSLKMTMDLRGYLNADPGAVVRLVACVGDATEVVDLATDKAQVKLKGTSKAAIRAAHGELAKRGQRTKREGFRDGDWHDRIEFKLPICAAKPVLQITLLLLVEHDTDKADSGGALLTIDSLDLAIATSEQGAL